MGSGPWAGLLDTFDNLGLKGKLACRQIPPTRQ